jgi:HPt (histidine-containing phosphotransfer) domain-containing protein
MIDDVRLHNLQLIMKEDFSDLVEIFIEDSISRANDLKYLLQQSPIDKVAVKINAHTLKGSSGNVCATKLQAMYLSLENMAEKMDLYQMKELLEEIEEESKIVFNELKTFNSNIKLNV